MEKKDKAGVNAASVAGLPLTIGAVVSEIKEKEDGKPGRSRHGGHMN